MLIHRFRQINEIGHDQRIHIAFQSTDRRILQLLCSGRHTENLRGIDAQVQEQLFHEKGASDVKQRQHVPLNDFIRFPVQLICLYL